jgi:hypothetical protein
MKNLVERMSGGIEDAAIFIDEVSRFHDLVA